VGKTQEVKHFRSPLTTAAAPLACVTTKPDQVRLALMELQVELLHPRSQVLTQSHCITEVFQ
jgi:hypothetical protein